MKTKREFKPIRFALIVFLGLIVFCLAQLSWWIIYQIDLSKQLSRNRAELLEQRIDIVSLTANRCFQQKSNVISYAMNTSTDKIRFFDSLLTDSIIGGYVTNDISSGERIITGHIDSTFYFDIDGSSAIYFNSAYPALLLVDKIDVINFNPSGANNGDNMTWVTPGMFSIAPEVLDEMEAEAHGRIVMFASEGSFFVIITLFGAFLIYRTLQRSESLKFRQQNFIHAVTHEFRTPLTSLRLYIQTLQSGKINKEKQQELYGKMLDDCYRLDGMVDNVLEAGYSAREDYRLNLVRSELASDLEEYLNNFEPFVQGLNGKIERRLEPEVYVRSDYPALERAVKAVVENALKYSAPENRTVTVTLTTDDKHARIAVADTGRGIPKHEQKNIFDRFYRIGNESTRAVKGTGLGLYLAQQTIEAHGGIIEVASEGTNKGAVFTIVLPRVS